MNLEMVQSFQQQNGMRGVHFYDGEHCEFVRWNLVIEFCNRMKDDNNPSHIEFEEKLLHAMANTRPDDEFVVCRQGKEVVTIECYRHQGL